MQRSKFKIIFLLVAVFIFGTFTIVKADLTSDCQNEDPAQLVKEGKVGQCTEILSGIAASIGAANATNQKNLSQLQSQLDSLNSRLSAMADQLTKYASDITSRQEDIGFTQKILEQKTRDHYTFLRLYDPLTPFLFADSASQAFQQLSLRQKAESEDVNAIEKYVNEVNALKTNQDSLQKSQAALASVQKQVAIQTNFLAGEVAKANAYLANLSSRQQAFIAAKLASLNIPLYALSAGGCSSDLTNGKDPGFSGGFGLFTFGVPNRVGLDQYGAWGRAKAQQSSDQILHAYYNFDGYQNFNATISVNDCQGPGCIGQGNIIWSGSLDDYVKRVYEVPDSWTDNDLAALKAQAIAVRSYVLAATNNGAQSICATQYCQVFQSNPKGGNWEAAVNSTPGQAMIQGGQPIKAYFSSTHGGYVYSTGDLAGWSPTSFTKRLIDTPSGSVSSIGDLRSNAYDKDSPWFYCDWGGRSDFNNTAWLKPDELADIVNVILLAKQDSSAQPHLSQVDRSNPEGVDTWSADTVRTKLGGSAYSTIDSVSLNFDFGSGKTTGVTVSGSGHTDTFTGSEFKDYFNLRAPSNIQIVGPLYNVETR